MTEKNKIYTSVDFERYHSGTMPANEMHALEKAALEDPFLADALEGYTNTSSFEKDITDLRKAINEKGKKENVFSISTLSQSGWWRIAALLIIISGIGYFFYTINSTKENSLAVNDVKLLKDKKDSLYIKNDSASIKNNVAFENVPVLNDNGKKKNTLPSIKPGADKENFEDNKNKSIASSSPAENSNSDYADSITSNMKMNKSDKKVLSQYSLRGRVTDEKGNPLASAIVKDKNRNEAVVTDTAGHFLLASPDSNTKAIVSVVGYEPKQITLQKDKEPVIAMNKSEANLDEVVVTGYGTQKKRKKSVSVSEELSGKVSGVEIKNLDTLALSNNEQFDQYIKANIKPVYDENNTRLKGEVFLSFRTNKKGRPYNIKVVKSSCNECEVQALELLEKGPDWIDEKQKLETVLIKF